MKLAAVLFDLDGTLLDHDAASATAVRSWLPAYGIGPRDIEAAVPLWSELEQRHYPAWRRGEVSFAEQRRRRTRDFFGALSIPVAAEELDAVFAQYLAGYEAAWTAFDDAVPALLRVRASGLRTGVLTNGDLEQQTDKVTRTGLAGHCGPVFASSELPAAKPDRRAFAEACRRLDARPDQVLMVGDNYEIDILAARAAGLTAVHLDRASRHPEPDPARISRLDSLLR